MQTLMYLSFLFHQAWPHVEPYLWLAAAVIVSREVRAWRAGR